MKTGILLVACCVLVSAGSARAQTSGAASDALSGTWTGQMGPDGGKLIPVTMQLKSDGKGGVSGTITGPPHPGTVKSATFDAKTGALKLDVAVQDEASTAVSFDGTLVDGTATGRVAIGTDGRGVFRLTKSAGATAGTANDAAASVRKNFAEVSGWIASAADAVPADKYSYRPTESVRTFGQLIGHVADAYNYFCARAAGQNVQWADPIEKGNTDKATIVPKLKQSLATCTTAYGGANQVGPLVDNVAHTNLHYGNVITYMRMMGLVPPSSR